MTKAHRNRTVTRRMRDLCSCGDGESPDPAGILVTLA
jgi:hypothetical protein